MMKEKRLEAVEVLYFNYEPPKTQIYEFSVSLTSFLEAEKSPKERNLKKLRPLLLNLANSH